MRKRLLVALLACLGCKETPKASSVVAPPAPSMSTAAPVAPAEATVAFCAFGGSGVLPADASSDEYYRVLAFVTVRTTAGATGVMVRATDVTGGGKLESTMRKLESVERLASGTKLTPPEVWGSRGTPFDGTLAPGDTTLRVEAWLTTRPRTRPFELRVEIGGPTMRAVGTCPLGIEWPTG